MLYHPIKTKTVLKQIYLLDYFELLDSFNQTQGFNRVREMHFKVAKLFRISFYFTGDFSLIYIDRKEISCQYQHVSLEYRHMHLTAMNILLISTALFIHLKLLNRTDECGLMEDVTKLSDTSSCPFSWWFLDVSLISILCRRWAKYDKYYIRILNLKSRKCV